MDAGYYYKTMDFSSWLDDTSGLNKLINEDKVKLIRQSGYAGNSKIWILIRVPNDLSFWDSWAIGVGWTPSEEKATINQTLPTEEINSVPFSHSKTADRLDDIAEVLDKSLDNGTKIADALVKAAFVGAAAYLLVKVVHPMVKAKAGRE